MITTKSQELKKFEYLKELLEENISDKTTEETTCYALWGNNVLELDPPKDSFENKKSKKDKKKEKKKKEQELLKKEPSVGAAPEADSSIEAEKPDALQETEIIGIEPEVKEPVSPYPLLRLTEGIFSGYSKNEPCYSLYYAFQSDVYYNFKKESNIEALLRSNWTPNDQEWKTATLALEMINKYGITKYSEHPPVSSSVIRGSTYQNILLVDQTIDDESVLLGSANEQTFNDMLLYAFDNYPYANIYVKFHPDTIDGKKEGYLQKLLVKHGLRDHPSIQVIDTHCNITSFFHFVQDVFVVTSQVGFEALLRNKNVRCFGMPFYSGWGLTTDMQVLTNAKPTRSMMDLFIALVLKHTLYINPFTKSKGTILDLLEYIALQQRHSNKKNVVFYNTEFAEQKNIENLLNTKRKEHVSINKLRQLKNFVDNFIITDKKETFKEVESFKYHAFIAESFLFSTGFYPKDVMSVIIDHNGPYHDPEALSDLDYMLNCEQYTRYELDCASKFIDAVKLKYMIDAKSHHSGNVLVAKQEFSNRKVIFVAGQNQKNELGFIGETSVVTSDYDLLVAICQKVENCLIVFKPAVGSGIKKIADINRGGMISLNTLSQEKKNRIVVDSEASHSVCIDACDEVHVISHNCGIEAIIKGKKVVTYGLPFYGGLGLTEDKQKYPRLRREVSLQEFVLATLMLYPRYKIPTHKGFFNALGTLEYDKNKHTVAEKPKGLLGMFKSFF